jgi:hypothetical protein
MPADQLPRPDPQRFAAVLLYARGCASLAFAEARRRAALASADAAKARFWSSVKQAILSLLPPCPVDTIKPN